MGQLIVQKYGGSSVADPEKIKNVARRVAESARQGHRMVVVVSAMGKTTDSLLALAGAITPMPDPREMDILLATGEQVTIGLLAMALQSLGHPACSFTGPQVGMVTDEAHTRARIKRITAERIGVALAAGKVAVVAGFQGMTEAGDITTLGRGGSDLTGVALAAALKADVCEIFTDVDGVYTADPNVVPDARKLARVSYDEMLEMAALGAKVLQARSVEFAKKYSVPVHVRSTFKPDPGTLVTREDLSMEEVVVTGITHDRGQAKLSILRVPDRPGIASRVFGSLGSQNIVVDMIVQNISRDGYTDISFTLARADRARAEQVLGNVGKEVGASGVAADDRVAKVSIVGVGMRSHAGVAARMFATLSREGVNIQMISTSEIAVSCVIEDKYTELAVRALHDAFELGKERGA
jgi:aspartate kinase